MYQPLSFRSRMSLSSLNSDLFPPLADYTRRHLRPTSKCRPYLPRDLLRIPQPKLDAIIKAIKKLRDSQQAL